MTALRGIRALGTAFALCWTIVAGAQVPVPPLAGHVTDRTATLTAGQQAALEQTLRAFEARKGSQLAVLIVPTTAPETIEQYSLRVAEQWKLGRRKIDDGAILVVAKDDRALRIEVGYGLEGALTDVTARRIISEIIAPRFREGDFAGGIVAGVEQVIKVVDGEALPAPRKAPASGIGSLQDYIPIVFIMSLVVGGLLRSLLGPLPGALVTGGIVAVIAWFVIGAVTIAVMAGVIALVLTLLGGGVGRLGGGFGGGGSGRGGFSGGGGGFGGGGASGKW